MTGRLGFPTLGQSAPGRQAVTVSGRYVASACGEHAVKLTVAIAGIDINEVVVRRLRLGPLPLHAPNGRWRCRTVMIDRARLAAPGATVRLLVDGEICDERVAPLANDR